MSITVTKEQRINELLEKIEGKPDRNSIRSDYPGLTIVEAVELKMLLIGYSEQQAIESIERARYGDWRE